MIENPNIAMSEAVVAHQQGQLEKARRLYAEVLRSAPNYLPALCNLGMACLQQGNVAEALGPLAAAVKVSPVEFDALATYGLALAMSGDHQQALTYLDRALAINPRDATALLNRGTALKDLGRYQEALETFERALAIDPRNPQLLNNYGTALGEVGRFAEAVTSYERALALAPNYVEALKNRGNALSWLDRYTDAVTSYRHALSIAPTSAELRYAVGFAHLRHGNYHEGFRDYEARLLLKESAPARREFAQPRWWGDGSLVGKTILLHAEQGHGDTIQFARYVPLVAQLGARVILEVQPALKPLMRTMKGAAVVIARGEMFPPHDCHCPLPSLPLAFATRLDTIPVERSYVAAPHERIAEWRPRIPQGRLRVGVVWCGNREFRNDRVRSMTLSQFAPLLRMPDMTFVSLNPGIDDNERIALELLPGVTHLAAEFRDFADTAAVLNELDLMIATDTGATHLAAALGRPVWVLLGTNADWRWLVDRQDSPWYPTVRLFRQSRFGDWAGVVARVADELAHFEPTSSKMQN